jgi:hypothetical protein
MVVGTATASGVTEAGRTYFESDTEILTIGDGATSITLDFTPNTMITFPSATSTLQTTTGSPAAFVIASQATGDLLYASSESAWARLGIQAAGYVLAGGATPAWSNAPQITTIELGAATDTTISRSAAGVIQVEGVTVSLVGATLNGSDTIGADPAIAANGVRMGTTGLIFEGSTADTIELLLTAADPTSADKTITLPNVTGTAVVAATSTTATEAMFATTTAGAPAFRAIATADLPAALPAASTFATSIAIGADPSETGAIMLSNGAAIGWEDATEATITHVNDTGLQFNLPIILSNSEQISNADDTEITFVGTEAISLDLDTGTANVVEWKNRTTSSTGVTTMSFAALNLATTGTILGAINVVITTDGSESPTAAQMYGTMFIADHDTATSDTTYTLPAAAAGMSACFYDNGGGTGGIIINPDDGDVIFLDGAAKAAGEAIHSPGVAGDGANGDFICILAIDTTNWITLGRSGTWVEETP